ncbi:MAG: helix-turn-helix domain-containing protein [Clostridiales bacterium]|nr:helix-turn-helix domain-containing protein [Eubacteriales bacterium]MDH7566544.1 helix-turn-helix domain-containing protein [Clostridiales bacterium]
MKTDINFIAQVLSHYQISQIQINGECTDIRSIEFLTETRTSIEPDVLYFGQSAAMKKYLPLQNTLNMIFQEDLPNDFMDIPNLNMIVLPRNLDFLSIFNEVQDALIKEKKYNLWSYELLAQLTHHEGIDSIVKIGYQMLGNPICVTDLSYNTIAITRDKNVDDDPVWNELYTKGYSIYDTSSLYINADLYHFKGNSFPPFYWQDTVSKYRKILCSIDVGNKPAGHLAVIEYEKPFGDDDIKLVSILREALSAEFQINKNIYSSDGTRHKSILRDILSGKTKDKESIEDKGQLLKFPLNVDMYAITIKPGDVSIIPGDSLEYLCNTLENLISNSKTVAYEGNVFMLVYCNKTRNLFKEDFQILYKFLLENKMKAGVSRCLYSLVDLRAHYLQSLHALRLGKILKDKNAIYFYEDYAIFHMMEAGSSQGKLQEYCHPSLLSLMDYDRQNNTSFTKTLYEFIKNSCSIADTANILKIHRTSLIYRLEKIKEIMNVDLNDNNILLLLHLSLKMVEYSDRNINLLGFNTVNFYK